jgi:hypothetical protein
VRPCFAWVLLRACVSAAACDRGVRAAAASVGAALLLRPWVLRAACDRGVRASECAFERTKCGRAHFGSFFSLRPFLPLLTMIQHNVLHNTKYQKH